MTQHTWRQSAVGFVVPLVIVALWQACAMLGWVNPQVLPSPLAVVSKLIEYALPLSAYDPAAGSRLAWIFSGELLHDTMGSMYRVLVGFLIGGGLGPDSRPGHGREPRHGLQVDESAGANSAADSAHRLHSRFPFSGSAWAIRTGLFS